MSPNNQGTDFQSSSKMEFIKLFESTYNKTKTDKIQANVPYLLPPMLAFSVHKCVHVRLSIGLHSGC